ncbi:YchJ family metal-binding protein [Microbacterium sp. Ru50]|uniref:YchJ family protein n=1 Tax=Microbacterium sp. Ru50 TaxID=2080744 RepID=UPI0027E478CA|nr:YchJ family metal-binding protein [Microbacterium sp. Ru50]
MSRTYRGSPGGRANCPQGRSRSLEACGTGVDMSFGEAALRRRPAATDPCPCGGGSFGSCCGPVLDGRAAQTAEQLMRSRYTAFAVRDGAHLARTWHPVTRPDDIESDGPEQWTGLTVVRAAGGPDDTEGTVEFTARWRSGTDSGELHEVSRFTRIRGRWLYVGGVVDPSR